jgi:hypothetical protein
MSCARPEILVHTHQLSQLHHARIGDLQQLIWPTAVAVAETIQLLWIHRKHTDAAVPQPLDHCTVWRLYRNVDA